ncbi:hypothetical protein H0O02_04985 [Candidatus Micrarchaeota archaeon]|nr:hypothetical protein [Candidatus Micrarchaeota archaeon]
MPETVQKKQVIAEEIKPSKIYKETSRMEFYLLLEKKLGQDFKKKYGMEEPSNLNTLLKDPDILGNVFMPTSSYDFAFSKVATEDVSKVLGALVYALDSFYWRRKKDAGKDKEKWLHVAGIKLKSEPDGSLEVEIWIGETIKDKKQD